MTLVVREMEPQDVAACVGIINEIIKIGGTTAYEEPYTEEKFEAHYLNEAATAQVVLHDDRLVGFQSCFEVEEGIYSVGSFTDQINPVRGAGRALIEGTIAAARRNGATAILAKITSDNTGGLSYYSKMGFQDHEVIAGDLTRRDGTVVDRVIKKLDL